MGMIGLRLRWIGVVCLLVALQMIILLARPFESVLHSWFPTMDAVDPRIDRDLASGALMSLWEACALGLADVYKPAGRSDLWNVYLNDQLVPGGLRVELNDFIRGYYPSLQARLETERHRAKFEAQESTAVALSVTDVDDLEDDEDESPEANVVVIRPPRRRRISLRFLSRLLPWVAVISLCLGVLGACALGPTVDPAPPDPPTVTHLPHRGAIWTNYCVEASPQYTQTSQANSWVAQALQSVVRENSDSVTLTVTFIDASPLLPESSPLSVTLQPINAFPSAPKLDPTPTPSGEPWKDAQNQGAVDQHNQQMVASYTDAVNQVKAKIATQQKQATQAAQTLKALQPPKDLVSSNPSVWGCVVAAADRFSQLPPGTTKVLCFASAMDERAGWIDHLSPAELSGLKGAYVDVVMYDTQGRADFSAYKQQSWVDVFNAAGANPTERWLDPGQTNAASPSIVFDPTQSL